MLFDTQTLAVFLLYGVFGVLLVASALVARYRHGSRLAALTFLVNLAMMSMVALGFPLWSTYYPSNPSTLLYCAVTSLLLLFVNVAVTAMPRATGARLLASISRRPRLKEFALASFATLVPLGVLEATAQVATRLGVVPYYRPIETRISGQTEDWRMTHIMDDNFREPDPVLMWRSVPRYPYSSQRFKGPDVAVPKPAATFRIICYGDSNTDGPSLGMAYCAQLQQILDAETQGQRRYEVMNAGVGGYSSYQGLMRFAEDADVFAPDLVLVSFGWNDVAGAIGRADSEFVQAGLLPARDPRVILARRVLLNYRFLLVALHVLSGAAPAAPVAAATAPRVSIPEFEANLTGFVSGARSRGAVPVLLTRPHRDTPDVLRRDPTWRRNVPAYNEAALRIARETNTLAIDVQRAFESRPEMFIDECHFTNNGHREMAAMLHQALKSAGHLH